MKRSQQALVWWANLSPETRIRLEKTYFPDSIELTTSQIIKIYESEEEEE